MAFITSSGTSSQRGRKPDLDPMLMINGLMIGFAVTGFVACAFLVVNGKAEEWLRQWRRPPASQHGKPPEG